ncbi:hypothetical protein CkaCkLH20_00333 [Colletotrichum karsti]|uniref:Uncharacterized protein n=1 Tax=Colletotrichum karsti TaxID=1095194 RepID=A0A9P6IF91_9PEZI|nr:uncharacterized protein CkaCkLH20_00333 [Colletotrichum karsti]KAF9882297.1 hypothetical protein CkaCkLH20_00333 [Colletotrichum karsti]
MALPQRLTGPHIKQVLGTTTSALAVYQNRIKVSTFLADKLQGRNGVLLALTDEAKAQFEDDTSHFALLSLAYNGYVQTWERYRQVYDLDPGVYGEGSTIFGLDRYGGAGGRAAFEADYGLAIVDVWQNSNRDYWFASMLRNAVAHGSTYQAAGRVGLYNVNPDTRQKTFSITMSQSDFAKLIMTALRDFVRNVGPVGGLAPLSDMLDYLL